MGSAHLIYIPVILFAGMLLGFFLGARAARDAHNLELRREEERQAAREAREARKAAKAKEAAGAEGH